MNEWLAMGIGFACLLVAALILYRDKQIKLDKG
jgi:hypothetical protein